jgi:hypothetical protein
MISRMKRYGTSRAFFGQNPLWVAWKADFAVYKNRICLVPLVLQSTRDAEVKTAAEFQVAESEVTSRCAVTNKPVRLRVTSLLNDHLSIKDHISWAAGQPKVRFRPW